jgi:pimeloyl-ACP methyl ester carboxylesterase
MLVGLNKGPGHEAVAWNSALIYDMIYTQPVYHEFKHLQMPTLLLIGDKDTTAIGSDIAPPEVKARLGNYAELGPQVAKLIPKGELITFEGMGHAPQIEEPVRFNRTLVEWLGK